MKQLLMLLIVGLLSFGLVGCSGESGTANSGGDATPASSDASSGSANAEITQTAFKVWESYDMVTAHGAVEIKNTGDVPIKLGDISISFVGKDDSIVESMSMILPVPEILQPGEVAYASDSTYPDGIKPDDLVDIEANIDFDATEETGQILAVNDLNIKDEEEGVKVTGRVENVSDKNADDVRVAIGLLDKDGKLLGVLTTSEDVTLAPGKTLGFSTNYPELNIKADEVATMEGKSYNWSWE